MSEITAASQEQSAGIEQVNRAIIEMDDVTQQNAALVEEAAAAAGSLQDQAGSLTQVVSVFKLDSAHAPVATAPRRPAVKLVPKKAVAAKLAVVNQEGANEAPRKSASVKTLPVGRKAPLASKPIPKKSLATGTSDDDWEEF
jgi:hypothetical protein